jgi:hypothetical protein
MDVKDALEQDQDFLSHLGWEATGSLPKELIAREKEEKAHAVQV